MPNSADDRKKHKPKAGPETSESELVKTLNDIILMKRQRRQNSTNEHVTAEERQQLVESYKNLETLTDNVKGRFFIEYSEGARTLQEEIVL